LRIELDNFITFFTAKNILLETIIDITSPFIILLFYQYDQERSEFLSDPDKFLPRRIQHTESN
ncbi:hypothetical protein DF186_25865, partial [Enterococcus hirae]